MKVCNSNKRMHVLNLVQKMKLSITDFFSKCDQIRSFLRIWSHLLKKSLMKNFIFCAVKHDAACLKYLAHMQIKKSLPNMRLNVSDTRPHNYIHNVYIRPHDYIHNVYTRPHDYIHNVYKNCKCLFETFGHIFEICGRIF